MDLIMELSQLVERQDQLRRMNDNNGIVAMESMIVRKGFALGPTQVHLSTHPRIYSRNYSRIALSSGVGVALS